MFNKKYLLDSIKLENRFFSYIIFYTMLLTAISSILSVYYMNLIFILVSISLLTLEYIFLPIGAFLTYKKMKCFLKNAKNSKGKIVNIMYDREIGFINTKRAIVKFKTLNGVDVIFINDICTKAINSSLKNGDEVDILYNPYKPSEAYINSYDSIWSKVLLLIVASISFFIIITSVFEIIYQKRDFIYL